MRVFEPRRYGAQEVIGVQEQPESVDVASMTFGTAQHYLLEMLDSFDKEGLKRAYIALQNRFAPLLDEQVLMMIYQRGEKLVTSEAFLALIKGAKVSKEQPFMY